MNFSLEPAITAEVVALRNDEETPALLRGALPPWHPAAEQVHADFAAEKPLRHITSGAVMPKSAKALASVCRVAATSRSRLERSASFAWTTGHAS